MASHAQSITSAQTLQRPTARERFASDNGGDIPLTESALRRHPAVWSYLLDHQDGLLTRKGTMLGTRLKRGFWWALLGVGDDCFAPFKGVWQAHGKDTFNPRMFCADNGEPWQANQAMPAFTPDGGRDEAERLLGKLASSKFERYLRSMSVEGTCC